MWYRLANPYEERNDLDINLLKRVVEQYGQVAPYWLAALANHPQHIGEFNSKPTPEMSMLAKQLNVSHAMRSLIAGLNQLGMYDLRQEVLRAYKPRQVQPHPSYQAFGKDYISDSPASRRLIDVFDKQFALRAVPNETKLFATPDPLQKQNIKIDFMLPCRVLEGLKKNEEGQVEPIIKDRVVLMGEFFGKTDEAYLDGAEFKKEMEGMIAMVSRNLGVMFIDSLEPDKIAQQLDIRRVLYDGSYGANSCLAKRSIEKLGVYEPQTLTVTQAVALTNMATKEMRVVDDVLGKKFREIQATPNGIAMTKQVAMHFANVFNQFESNKYRALQLFDQTGDADVVINTMAKLDEQFQRDDFKALRKMREFIGKQIDTNPDLNASTEIADQAMTNPNDTAQDRNDLNKLITAPPKKPAAVPNPLEVVTAPKKDEVPEAKSA